MKSLIRLVSSNRYVLLVGVCVVVGISGIELAAILALNHGQFIYTLDDPYIHLALAEQIQHLHYGINSGEYSAPSSSILWPFLLAPFATFDYFPLLLNFVFALGTVLVFVCLLNASFTLANGSLDWQIKALLLTAFILATNVIGLIFTGMEHSLQQLVVLAIAYGLVLAVETKRVSGWLIAAIVVAPLVRYDCAGISVAALAVLALDGHWKLSVVLAATMMAGLAPFSLLLAHLGLPALPTSVLIKSAVVESGGGIHSVIDNVRRAFIEKQGVLLLIVALAMLCMLLFRRNAVRSKLALAALIAISAHLVAGKYGAYNRYEIYVLTFVLAILLYLCAPLLEYSMRNGSGGILRFWRLRVAVTVAGFTLVIGTSYLTGLFTIPVASNNIYEQQYQMHRFVTEQYRKSVAVNDLGLVSYRNDNYVLDLWGLGSHESYTAWKRNVHSPWMNQLVKKHDVGLVIIYESWFNNIPVSWTKVAELALSRKRITPADDHVSFFSTSPKHTAEIQHELEVFRKTLPDDVILTIFPSG